MQVSLLSGCGVFSVFKGIKNAKAQPTPTPEIEVPDIDLSGLDDILGTDFNEIVDQALDNSDEDIPQGPADKDKWEGTWFGWMIFSGCTGKFKSSEDASYACYMVAEFDDDSTGKFSLFNSWDQFADGEFEIKLNQLHATKGQAFGADLNPDNWNFIECSSSDHEIVMTDTITDVDGDDLGYVIYLKPWGTMWPEMDDSRLYEDIFKPYKEKVENNENPPHGFINQYYANGGSGSTETASGNGDTSSDGGSDADVVKMPAVKADNYTLVDNEYIKIVVDEPIVDKYNSSWFGYKVLLTNKTDYEIYFSSVSEPMTEERIGGGDTCFYQGKKTKTHFGMMLNPGISDYEMTLVIDGVTDVSDVKDMAGYIEVLKEGEDLIDNYPYHFE